MKATPVELEVGLDLKDAVAVPLYATRVNTLQDWQTGIPDLAAVYIRINADGTATPVAAYLSGYRIKKDGMVGVQRFDRERFGLNPYWTPEIPEAVTDIVRTAMDTLSLTRRDDS
jgi:hypothetical protein